MKTGDLNPNKAVWIAPTGGSAHLSPRCQSLQQTRREVKAGKLWDTTPVCKHCMSRMGRGEQEERRRSSAGRALDMLGPGDLP